MQLPNLLKPGFFQQKYQWIADPIGFMENAVQQYPDIFSAKLISPKKSLIFVHHPQGIQEILTNDRKKFATTSKTNAVWEPLFGTHSVIMLDGDRHRKRRQLLMPSFHGERMRAYGQLICDITDKIFSQLPTNKVFSAAELMREISLQVILQAIFGLYEGHSYEKIIHQLGLMLDLFHSPITASFLLLPFLQKDLGYWSPWGKFLRYRQEVDKLLYAEITQRRENPDPGRTDILSLLMSAQDEEGNGMTDKELRDELLTLLLAGHENTATVMSWAFYWSHYLPEVKEKLLQELHSLGSNPDPVSISKLPYLSAFCNETLRIYPVAMLNFSREVQEPVELMGNKLYPGTEVVGCIYLLHQREDLYPQPKEFKPERFLQRQFSPYEFLAFGGGVRRCVGDALAMFEIKLVLATVLLNYHLTLADNKPEIPQRRAVTLAPANGVRMIFANC
jgi:cytochrome P450 family 110